MIKKSFLVIIPALVFTSCIKEELVDDVQVSDVVLTNDRTSVSPYEFASLSDLQNAISDYDPGVGTKTSGVLQLSYAQTVMQEEGYDDQPYAIMSESFGSVLNPDGEVVFGGHMLKLCTKGILFSTRDNIDLVRTLSEDEQLFDKLSVASDFLFDVDSLDGIYAVEGC